MIKVNIKTAIYDFEWVIRITNSSKTKTQIDVAYKCFNLWELKHVTNNVTEKVRVPITYGPKEKFLRKLREDNTITDNQHVQITLPRLGFDITTYLYDPTRKVNKLKNITKQINGTEYSMWSEVPYNINFNLYLFTRNVTDTLQIVEQILPNFAPDFTVNGVLVIDNSDSVVSLGSSIRNSNLSRLGTLEFLNIEGDLRISEGSTPYFNIVNGHVEITSVSAVGSVNNVDIGLVSPGDGNFKSLNVGPGDSQGELTVQGDIYTTGFVSIAAAPTEVSHATRKDYVDARISAFAIAFGA